MKSDEVIWRIILFPFSKPRKAVSPNIHKGYWMWETRDYKKVKRCKPPSQKSSKFLWHLKIVESPLNFSFMESLDRILQPIWCLAFVYHQNLELCHLLGKISSKYSPRQWRQFVITPRVTLGCKSSELGNLIKCSNKGIKWIKLNDLAINSLTQDIYK